MDDKEYLNRLIEIAKYFPKYFPMTSEEALKPKVVSKKAWNTLRSWIAELIIVDGNQIDITYSKRDKSEIRITIQHIDSQQSDVYHLSEDDIGVAVLPERISKLLRDVWNQKELKRCQTDPQYFINRYTYIIGADPYKK